MLKNYLKITLRNLRRNKAYSFINIAGLAIGMACCILILLFVQDELSYDRFHTNKENVYRIQMAWRNPQTGETSENAINPYRLAEAMRTDFPELPQIVRLYPQGRTLIRRGEKRFNENDFYFVDPNIFEVFSLQLFEGDPATALRDPYTVVITKEIARKYFGDENPIGQSLTYDNDELKITGIMAELPRNSHFHCDFIASMAVANQEFSRIVLENWGEMTVYTYLMLPAGTSPVELEGRFDAFVKKHMPDWASAVRLKLIALTDIHLHSHTSGELEANGDVIYVYAFTAIAFFILLIACINFMNLATARSAKRAREVGMRKVLGAVRAQLRRQFLGESLFFALVALLLALVIVQLVLPAFNGFVEREFSLDLTQNWVMLASLLAIALFVGLVAGSYPAFVLSTFEPVQVMKGAAGKNSRGAILRKTLVTLQFAISIFLIVVTAIVYRQLQYARDIKLGFNKEHVVAISGVPLSLRQQFEQFRNELAQNPGVVMASISSRVPPGRLSSNLGTRPEGVPEDQRQGMQTVWTDFDFIELLGLELAAGRSFSRKFATDATSAFILNEAAVKALGWTPETAIGKSFGSAEIVDWGQGQWIERNGQVIGVLKDFHFESLHDEIVPTGYFVAPYMAWNAVVRIRPENIASTMKFLEGKWEEINPGQPFE
ncbi:MAG: ABC transporter permease, partial [bacterium]